MNIKGLKIDTITGQCYIQSEDDLSEEKCLLSLFYKEEIDTYVFKLSPEVFKRERVMYHSFMLNGSNLRFELRKH